MIVRRLRATFGPVHLLTLGLAILAIVGTLLIRPVGALHPGAPAWWVMVAAIAIAEATAVHIQFRRDSMTLCLTEIPIVVGLALVAPAVLIVERLLGTLFVLVVIERLRPLKVVFNLGRAALETLVAIGVYRFMIAGSDPLSVRGWIAAIAAILISDQLSEFLVNLVIRLAEGPGVADAIGLRFVSRAVLLINTALGALLVLAITDRPSFAVLVVLVALGVYGALRGYAVLADRNRTLEHLFQFTTEIGPAVEFDAVARVILERTEELLRSERAEILILPSADHPTMIRVSLAADGGIERVDDPRLDLADEIWGAVASGQSLWLPHDVRGPAAHRALAELGGDEAIIRPLTRGDQIIGALVAVDRSGDVHVFEDHDVRLLKALAAHAAVALEKGRLVEVLRTELEDKRHRALHDALTGLPNRLFFEEQVEDVVAGRRGVCSAVMIMDLNRFKEVNDTLGHGVGDSLLRAIAGRLGHVARGGDVVARLGGDEFGILVGDIKDEEDAVAVARRLMQQFETPFVVDGRALTVGASIGIAMYPDDGTSAATLVQRADVAMYVAKAGGQRWDRYDPEFDRNSPQRLVLGGDLARAIEFDELTVHFQPKLSVDDQSLVGAEALVRWRHPERGLVGPDEFIDLVEERNLSGPLARFVLGRALAECARWHEEGIHIGVAVNCSVSNLLDPGFADDVEVMLAMAAVPPTSLTLEVTESMQVLENPKAVDALRRIHDLGVQISVDDFGTGYSSLAYLRRLPIDEVKVDRSFVQHMLTHEDDAAIVGAIIDLCRSLGMRVVAEGVETSEVWTALHRMGCDHAQGYWVSRPVPADEFDVVANRLVAAERLV